MDRRIANALITGVVGAVIGIFMTWLASVVWPTPWILMQAFIAVGIATFCGAAAGVYFYSGRPT